MRRSTCWSPAIPTRGGEHVLGRFTMPETDVYSTCLAIQNLWLAARAEGVGVGWMSIMEPRVVKELLGIPEHIVPVAYLTLGYPVEFAEKPMLARGRLVQAAAARGPGVRRPPGRGPRARSPRLETRQAARPVPTAEHRACTIPAAALQRNAELTKPAEAWGCSSSSR